MNNRQNGNHADRDTLNPFIPASEGDRNGLKVCQVQTPEKIVEIVWSLIKHYRDRIEKVIDFGAGDGRFAFSDNYTDYLGIEYDETKQLHPQFPRSAHFQYGCALDEGGIYDAVIGNPPYVQHHYISAAWKKKAIEQIKNQTGIVQNTLCHMYLYFLWMSLFRTNTEGLIALVLPYEWVSRPSAKQIREYIRDKGWGVDVYKFDNREAIFPNVLTTASITIVDKSDRSGNWNYFNINKKFEISPRQGITGSGMAVLLYERGNDIKSRRGMSPGSQKIFTITEEERLENGISLEDVVPAVTTFRDLPSKIRILSHSSFKRYFIKAGKKCWLLKTDGNLSGSISDYLAKAPKFEKQRWTCQNRDIWYKYRMPPIPFVLYNAGFVHHGPKSVLNKIGAIGVGSVHGIIGNKTNREKISLLNYIREFDFENRVVAHAKTLKKVEVNQMNGVINGFFNARN